MKWIVFFTQQYAAFKRFRDHRSCAWRPSPLNVQLDFPAPAREPLEHSTLNFGAEIALRGDIRLQRGEEHIICYSWTPYFGIYP